MFDEITRQAIAHKRFSLISPVINKLVDNNIEYYRKITSEPIEMPYYGFRKYSAKTLEGWYCDYMKGDLEALKPSIRGDKGRFRKIDDSTAEKIRKECEKYPNAPSTMIYDLIVGQGIIDPEKISTSTIYRFIKNKGYVKPDLEKREIKRFSHEFVNEQWQSDVLYGPYIKNGKKSLQTYLHAYIDDCSRLITHAEFFYTQGFEALRSSFKEAVLKRGIPKTLYTDNAKIYRSQQFEWMCARLKCLLTHSKPFVPKGRGKVERFFLTVRTRFLSTLDYSEIKSIDDLNLKFSKWLDEDYQKKPHSALDNVSPLDKFYSQIPKIILPDNPELIKEKFYLTTFRKVNHDATLSINKVLYEVDSIFSKSKIELRYEPEWIGNPLIPILIYKDDKKISKARMVDFSENSNYKRRGRPNIINDNTSLQSIENTNDDNNSISQTISFKDISKEEE
jgi:putative transposase